MEVLVASSLFIIVARRRRSTRFVTMLGTTAENAAPAGQPAAGGASSEIVLSRQLRNLAGPDEGQPQAFRQGDPRTDHRLQDRRPQTARTPG